MNGTTALRAFHNGTLVFTKPEGSSIAKKKQMQAYETMKRSIGGTIMWKHQLNSIIQIIPDFLKESLKRLFPKILNDLPVYGKYELEPPT